VDHNTESEVQLPHWALLPWPSVIHFHTNSWNSTKLWHGVWATLSRFGGAPDTDTRRKRTQRGVRRYFLGRTRPSLWTRKRHIVVLQKGGMWTQLQSWHRLRCRQIHGEEKTEDRKGKIKQKKKKNLKRKHYHILINLII